MNNDLWERLREAVRQRLKNGDAEETIKQELRNAEYTEEDIEYVFAPAPSPEETPPLDNTSQQVSPADVPTPDQKPKKHHWLRNTGIAFGLLLIAWITFAILVPNTFIFELYESNFRTATKLFYDRTNGDYTAYCDAPEIAPLIDKVRSLTEYITCDSSPGGFDLIFRFETITYTCVPAAYGTPANDYFVCLNQPDFISEEIEEYQNAMSEHYKLSVPPEVIPPITDRSIQPDVHTFDDGQTISKVTLPHSEQRSYYLDLAHYVDGTLILSGGFLGRLLLINGHMPECLQTLDDKPRLSFAGIHQGEAVVHVSPVQSPQYILHGCNKIGGQYRETNSPVSIYDDIAFVVESDARSRRDFLVYKGNEYAKYSYRINHIQELGGHVAFVAEPRERNVYALHKGEEILVEIPKQDYRLKTFITDGDDYYYVLEAENDRTITTYQNGTLIASLPAHLKNHPRYTTPFPDQKLPYTSSGLYEYKGTQYNFNNLFRRTPTVYMLDNHLLATAYLNTTIYFDPDAPWADAFMQSIDFMYQFASFDDKL